MADYSIKMLFNKKFPLYLITDREISGLNHSQIVKRAISSGINVIQLREKELSKREIYLEALKLRNLTRGHKALLIINDYLDIAVAVNADGVHLGQDDMPLKEARQIVGKKMIIGISTHSYQQALNAEQGGADYIGFGPVFNTSTKDAGRPKGLKMLEKIKRSVQIPVVAIGGISADNIRMVLDAGADGAAIASGILRGNIKKNVINCLESCDQSLNRT